MELVYLQSSFLSATRLVYPSWSVLWIPLQ